MRQFKFRIWDYGQKTMDYSRLWSVNAQGKLYYGNADFSDYRVELMKDLGINDIHRTLMYRGDIVKLPMVDNGLGDVATFEFNAPNYYLKGAKGNYEISSKHNPESYEVIGNIYEGVDGKPWDNLRNPHP